MATQAVAPAAETPTPKGPTLMERLEAVLISEQFLEEAGGELTPEVEALLEEASADFNEKVERVALKVKQLEGHAAAIDSEIDRLQRRAAARYNAAKRLKEHLQMCLEAAGRDKVEGLLCTVALQKNPPKLEVPPSADLDELRAAGFPYLTIVPEKVAVDKKAVLDAVKAAGEIVLPNGWVVTQGRSVRIR